MYDAAGTLVTAASGSPRLTYDPATLQPLGLLVEEQRTNLLAYSEQLDNAAWVKRGTCTITANAATAPDGQVSADLVAGVGIGGNDLYQSNVSISAPTRYEISFYIKKVSTSGVLAVQSPAGPANGSWTVDLSLLGSGWERITRSHAAVTITTEFTGSGGVYNGPYFIASSGGPLSFYLWGLQAEIGSFATSYIPTGAASATRAADVVTCSGSAFSQWFNAAGGTVVVDFLAPPGLVPSTYPRVWEFQDAADSSLLGIWVNGGGSIRVGVYTAGAWQEINLGAATAGGRYKVALRYGASGIAVCCNGGAVATNASTITWANIAKCSIGQSIGQQWLNAPIRRALAYRRELTNAQMQALTA
jgi:hypothetical protein